MQRLLSITLFLGLAAFATLQLSAPVDGAGFEGATPDETPLGEAMEEIETHIRTLRKSLKDPAQNEASLTAIVGLQHAVAKAKVEAPHMAEPMEGKAKVDFVLAYRKAMIAFDRDLLTLEENVIDGDLETAMATYKGIRAREDKGHERFTADE